MANKMDVVSSEAYTVSTFRVNGWPRNVCIASFNVENVGIYSQHFFCGFFSRFVVKCTVNDHLRK